MKIGVVGAGIVGRATARSWLEHSDGVLVYDVVKERRTDSLEDVLLCDLVFVCLRETDLDGFFSENHRFNWSVINLVIRSTVPVGTTKRLREKYRLLQAVHSPEFLTGRCAITDAQMPAQLIVGDPTFDDRDVTENSECMTTLTDAYCKRWPGIPLLFCSSDESEAIKLIVNAFAACKVSLFNEFRTFADKMGLCWDRVIEGVMGDGRIGHSWSKVPGPDGRRGFGGACLPKDVKMLASQMEAVGAPPFMLAAALHRNALDRKEQR